MRFLGAMTHLPCERQNFASPLVERAIVGSMEVNEVYARGVGKDMQKNLKRSPKKCQTSNQRRNVSYSSDTINIFFAILRV